MEETSCSDSAIRGNRRNLMNVLMKETQSADRWLNLQKQAARMDITRENRESVEKKYVENQLKVTWYELFFFDLTASWEVFVKGKHLCTRCCLRSTLI